MESLFKLMPDTSPCDMAIICRKPCFEVYYQPLEFCFKTFKHFLNQIYIHRKFIFSDEEILENQQPRRKSDKIKFSKYLNLKSLTIHSVWFIVETSRRRRKHRIICMVRAVHIGSYHDGPQQSIFLSGPQLVIIKGHAISIRIAFAITSNRDVSGCAAVLKIVRNLHFRLVKCLSNTSKIIQRFIEIQRLQMP